MPNESQRFKEIKTLGQGQFGKTVLVEDREEANRLVAIKVPVDESTERALIREVINNEILYTHLKEIQHANIVKYLGYEKHKGLWVMIMEYVEGKDLRSVMGRFRNRPPLDVNLALRIATNACSGLVAAHGARVFHSDLKPENILVRDKDGVAMLCDFGVSRILRSTLSAADFAGTWLYSSPELLSGNASFPADIWSLSVVLYEMVTGALPFEWTGDFTTFKAKVDREAPAPPKRLNPNVDDRLNALILRGLEKDTNKRYKKAKEMLTALETCAVPVSEVPKRTDDPSPRNITRRVVGALSALAFLGAGVVYVRQPPVIETLTCDPCVMEAGKTTTLSWKTKGASKVRLERDSTASPLTTSAEPSGAFKDTPKKRTEYTLVATSRFGVAAKSRKITVAPVDIAFSSMGVYIPMLFWKVSEPTAKVSLSARRGSLLPTLVAENLPAQGMRSCERSTTYVLTAKVDGVTLEKSLYVSTSIIPPGVLQDDGLPSQIKVVGDLLFFASTSNTPPEPGFRKYQTLFTLSSSKLIPDPWIFWQLKLRNDGGKLSQKIHVVAVWHKKNILDTYTEVFRAKAVELDPPDPGLANTHKSGWSGGLQGWLVKNSLLSAGLRGQEFYHVDLFAGSKKIASGGFSVRSDTFARRSTP